MAVSFRELRKEVVNRIWYKANGAFAFLVDAPHTFGHSQLVVAIRSDKEDKCFSNTARHIAACIAKLRAWLPAPGDRRWKSLAKYTRSSGPYKKTLILRVSADEDEKMYKIHLIPYFKSHLDATNKLYRVTHDKRRNEKGGLLNWLGQREVMLDYDMRFGRENQFAKTRIDSFHLEQLALKLGGGRKNRIRRF